MAHAAIVGGTPSDASQDFVLVIANLVDAQGLECNAELVAPNLLVTARHCVAQLDDSKMISCVVAGGNGSSPTATGDYDPSHFTIATDEALTQRLDVHAIRIIDAGAAKLCGDDIAYVVLDSNVDGVPIAQIALDPAAIGDTLTVVGSGQIDQNGTLASARMQRTGVTVLGVGPTAVSVGAVKEGISAGEIGTTVAFCNGDSGGPAIDSLGHITALVSRTPSCANGPDVFTSVAAHLDVAEQAFAAAGVAMPGTDAGSDAPDASDPAPTSSSSCASSPRGSSFGAWLVALVIMFTAARRRSATGAS